MQTFCQTQAHRYHCCHAKRDPQRQDGNILGNSSPLRPVSEKSQMPQFTPFYTMQPGCIIWWSGVCPNCPGIQNPLGHLATYKSQAHCPTSRNLDLGVILHTLQNLRTIISGLMATKKETVYSGQWITTCLHTEINPRSLKFHMHGPLSSQVEP